MHLHHRILTALLSAGTALAAAPCLADTPPADSGADIVVTATKQRAPLSKVPISIEALSRDAMDKQNIRSFNDVVRNVPGLTLDVGATADRIPSISIRGISSDAGAATTGIYVDDVPLQKRTAIGVSGSGTPIPHLFDLDRVEVLRGPQGTLFGGSSLGGAIRFVTPEPDLNTVSLYTRDEVSGTQSGAASFGLGAAISVPLIADKLALRVSADVQHTGGYIDHVSRFTGAILAKNTNSDNAGSYRAALLWEPAPGWKITPSFYYSYDNAADSDAQWSSIPAQTVDGYSYAAVHYGKYQTGDNCDIGDDYAGTEKECARKQPRKQRFFVPELKVEGDLGFAQFTTISSYINDRTTGQADYSYIEAANFQGGYPFVHNVDEYTSTPYYENTRNGVTQELRLASRPGSRLGWVVGGFFSHYNNNSNYHIVANLDDLSEAVFGASPTDVFGLGVEPGNITYHRNQQLTERSIAGFGEANYAVTGKLKVFAGARVSQETFSYHQVAAGVFSGYDVATTANGGLTDGSVTQTPVTPRFGMQYQVDSRTMIYATASKGYRVGGVNQPPPAESCASDLAQLGITSTPITYQADHLWSYEAGVKGHSAGNAASFDANGFIIDWNKIQTSYTLPTCGFGYTVNGATAVSRGVDLQGSLRPVQGLTLTGEFTYTDAHYTKDVAYDGTVYMARGDKLSGAPYRLNVSAEYARPLGSFAAYARLGYQYSSGYDSGAGPNTASYAPDDWHSDATHFATARVGFGKSGWDLSVFADNLFNSDDKLSKENGRSGCDQSTGAACSSYDEYTYPLVYTTFRPRTIGLTFTLRQ